MMRNYLICFSIAYLLLSCGQGSDSSQLSTSKLTVNKLGLSKGDSRIVFVGGTLISSMENYGYFETSVIMHLPNRSISFRNLGWPADDVFGLARSQFGSAQNTRSWQPPSAEEGFGSKVLMEHILQSNPTTLIIGYGAEAAYVSNDAAFDLFKSGYQRLLDFADSLQLTIILLSPPKQELALIDETSLLNRNGWLNKTSAFIGDQAGERGYQFINLFESLVEDPSKQKYTQNGVQLNELGYQKMCDLLLQELAIKQFLEFEVNLNTSGEVQSVRNAKVTNWAKTVRGVQFNLTPFGMAYQGRFSSTDPLAIYIDGSLRGKGKDSIDIVIPQDSIIYAKIKAAVFEKNRLHRYRLRPLNEAYIYLFRRHEMGHLAYEMDDFDKLVLEKEADIDRLAGSSTHQINVEIIRPWQPPKNYRKMRCRPLFPILIPLKN